MCKINASFACPFCGGNVVEFLYQSPGLYDGATDTVNEHPTEGEDVNPHIEMSCYACGVVLTEDNYPDLEQLAELVDEAFDRVGTEAGKRDEACRLAMDGITDPESLMVSVRALADVETGLNAAARGGSTTREVTALIQEQGRLLNLIRELVQG